MIFLREKPVALTLLPLFLVVLFPFVLLGGCGLDNTGGGNLIYLEYDGKTYCPAPYGWEVFGERVEVSAKVGYGRKTKKRKCTAFSFGDGTFLIYENGTEKTLLCRCDGELPGAKDATEENGVLLRLGETDLVLDTEKAGNLLGCICPERAVEATEKAFDVGLVFAVFPTVGARKLLGTIRCVRGGGFILSDEKGNSFLLPDDFSVDTLQ